MFFFSTFTQAWDSNGGVQLQGGILKGIFTHNKAENERCFDDGTWKCPDLF